MKKVLIGLLACFITLSAQANNWTEDWLDQATIQSPGYFEGQKRGYVTAGSFNARWRQSVDSPFSISKPRLSAGCGGIDIFTGSMAFLDADYLVEKMQAILQAAPAVAFQMALEELCVSCNAAISKAEEIIDFLNSLQLDDCKIAKDIASVAMDRNRDEIIGNALSIFNMDKAAENGTDRGYKETKDRVIANGDRPTEDTNDISSCSTVFKSVFDTGGSILQKMTQRVGLEDYAPVLRGFIGDVVYEYNPTDKVFTPQPVGICRSADASNLDDFVNGHYFTRDEPAVGSVPNCQQVNDGSLYQLVDTRLASIANKIPDKDASLDTDEEFFLNAIPFPIYATLKASVNTGTESATIAGLREPVAREFANAIVRDLVTQTRYVTQEITEVANSANCDVTPVLQVIKKTEVLHKRALAMARAVYEAKAIAATNAGNILKYSQTLQKQADQVNHQMLKGN